LTDWRTGALEYRKGGNETRISKLGTTIALAVAVVVLLFALVGISLAADPTAEASRAIDLTVVQRGEEAEITVEFTSLLTESKSFALLEDYPDGWAFTRGTDDAFFFRPGPPPEWVWIGVGAGATKTVTYTLTVPMDAEAGNYTIDGTVTGAEVANPVGGDYTITVRVLHDLTTSSTAGGSVTDPGEGTYTYDEGTVVNLVAAPSAGYRFDEWTGDASTVADINDPTTTITMNGDYAVTAEFVKTYDLTTSSTAGGSVSDPGEGTYTYDGGTVVDLVATTNAGYRFNEWTGDVGDVADVHAATTTITMNGDYSVTADFCELSTYQFIYYIPEHIVACEETEIPVTFQTDVLGYCGYGNVRYKFYADGPGDVTFKATDPQEVEHTFVNSGYWELQIGLDLPADYNETTAWTLHFSTPGEYSITFSLVDVSTDDVIGDTTATEPLTVEAGDILNYYRSLHEPLDEVTTLDLLAAADDWSGYVALPCFGEPITMAQLLALADEWIAAGL
jgi:Divergent InlB B-repeat domain